MKETLSFTHRLHMGDVDLTGQLSVPGLAELFQELARITAGSWAPTTTGCWTTVTPTGWWRGSVCGCSAARASATP